MNGATTNEGDGKLNLWWIHWRVYMRSCNNLICNVNFQRWTAVSCKLHFIICLQFVTSVFDRFEIKLFEPRKENNCLGERKWKCNPYNIWWCFILRTCGIKRLPSERDVVHGMGGAGQTGVMGGGRVWTLLYYWVIFAESNKVKRPQSQFLNHEATESIFTPPPQMGC